MKVEICTLLWFCLLKCVLCVRYDNVSSLLPTERQMYDYKIENPKPDLLTTSHGEPVDLRDIIQLNSEQFTSLYHLDLNTKFLGERTIERVVHAKGTGAFGYFIVTNDVSKYTSADVFNGLGKKTRLIARFSSARGSLGASDVDRELKGLAVKFYTKEGNLDLTCLQVPVFSFKDPALFPHFVHVFKRNPRTFIADATAAWDLITLRPDLLQVFLYTQSDLGTPDGYRMMDAFPIHTYELSNKNGDTHYSRVVIIVRRALAVRGNMVARRFSRCTEDVKLTLFKAYCQNMYTGSLWVNHTKKSADTLRIQYNNVFRMMLRLPRFCSASGMFAEYQTDGFEAIIRKKTASLIRRIRDSRNSILKTLSNRCSSSFWVKLIQNAI